MSVYLLQQVFANRFPLDDMAARILDILNFQDAFFVELRGALRHQIGQSHLGAICAPRGLISALDRFQFVARLLNEFLLLIEREVSVGKHLHQFRPGLCARAGGIERNEQNQLLRSLQEKKAVKSDQVAFVAYPPPGPEVGFTANHFRVKQAMEQVVGNQQTFQGKFNIGMTEALIVGAYYKRLLGAGILFGDTDHHLGRLADRIAA